jgi:hypothetical protein
MRNLRNGAAAMLFVVSLYLYRTTLCLSDSPIGLRFLFHTNRSIGSPDLFVSGAPNNHHTANQYEIAMRYFGQTHVSQGKASTFLHKHTCRYRRSYLLLVY